MNGVQFKLSIPNTGFIKMLYFSLVVMVLYALCDFNYLIRTLFTVICGRLYQKTKLLTDTTVIYGVSTFQDCDLWFSNIRPSRLVRELDFARYHFYDRTGVYRRSKELGIKSLQGSTLTTTIASVPMFVPYKISTKLVYWDERSLFLEHEVVTLHDNKLRYFLTSRQYALGIQGASTDALLKGLPGSENKPDCPKYIQYWLKSMDITSGKLRRIPS